MRNSLFALAFLLAPAALPAQGRIIVPCQVQRPCDRPNWDAQVQRTGSDIRVVLEEGVLHYEVEERFTNRGGRLGEADYMFPLPHGAAFEELKLSIDGELVAGEVLGADEARRIYEDIVRRHRDPALVEWMGHGLLRTRIFPIQPGEERRVVVRFQSVAPREGDALRIDYFRGSDPARGVVPAAEPGGRVRPPVPQAARTTFTFEYPEEARFGRPYSPTHSLDIDEVRDHRRVRVRGDASEVALLLPLRRSSEAAISVLTHAARRDDGFALITLSPPELRQRATARDVTFVLDVSGSMSGKKMAQAREAGRQLLATLEPHDRFRMIDFSSDVRTFRDDFVMATPANLREAGRYLESLKPAGGTNIAGALEEALRTDESSERLPLVLFLTDGEPTVGERDPAAIAAEAARQRGDARVFTFGLGADVNVPLIEQLALEGRGTAHFVRPEESVERMVGLVASRLTAPVATGVRIRAEGVRLVQTMPSETLDLFAGQDIVVLTRYEGSGRGRIIFEGRSASGPVRWSAPVQWAERERDNAFVARLWATQRVGWLSAERRRNGPSRELDDEIRELGERYGIPTELTSYFVKEPGMIVQTGAGQDAALNAQIRGVTVVPQAAAPAREEQFAAARDAAARRQTTSTATLDSVAVEQRARMMGQSSLRLSEVVVTGAAANAPVLIPERRTIGGRTLELRDSVWTDVSLRPEMKRLAVAPFSPAYFAVLEQLPELREAFALGDRVVVAGRTLVIEVKRGGVERLGPSERGMIEREW